MPPRKQAAKEPGGREFDDSTQDEDEDALDDDDDDNGELSSSLLPPPPSPSTSREKRKKEREGRSKPKEMNSEMTEEEMMDLALRLSEQEASIAALRRQKEEEEAVMKAIHESMVSQTQPCPSRSLLAEASRWTGSRRKLSFPNGRPASDVDQAESEDGSPEIDRLSPGAKRSGDESNNRDKRRKRKAGSPLLEMPDLSQTHVTSSQASTPSSDCLDLNLDSQQSSESTQIDECQLRKSPVFPLTGCRPEVHVPRLSQDLLETVRTSGFVLCTQDSEISPARPKSPTFPKGPRCSANRTARPKSPVFSETLPGKDDEDADSGPEYVRSPVFGRNAQREKSPSACKPPSGVCNSGFTFTSQESLTSSVRSASCRPKSPVFPRSPVPPPIEISDSPTFPEPDVGPAGQSLGRSPASDRSRRRQAVHPDERRESTGGPAQDSESKDKQDVRLNKDTDDTEELNETLKDGNSAETELTSDMRLLWSDSDEDVTPVGSPSPVFPEEKPVCQPPSRETGSSPGTGLSCRPSSSSSSSGRQQPVPSSEPAGRQTVHYYWGVPFCPRGLDPDTYTQVILAQMEVYEKSLKQAQRGLLRKAEWGEAILPQPEKSPSPPESPADSPQPIVSRRRALRLNRQRLSDAAETPPVEVDDEDDDRGEEEKEKEVQEERKGETKEEEEKKDEGGQELDTDVCEVCPETQLSDDDRMQDQMMDTDASPQLRPKSPELPEVEMILPDDSPAREEPRDEEEMEVEVDDPADRKTKGDAGLRKEEVEEDMEDTYVEEIKDGGLQRSACPELEPAVVPESPETSVDCPICQQSFPVTEIEMHAAYCDGEVAVTATRRPKTNCFQASPKPRRKRTRRGDAIPEDTNDSSNSNNRNREKCFICQRAVPQRDFGRHTELCLQQQTAKTAARGNLLSALEQTDSRDSEPGPSRSRLQTGDVIDLLDDDDDEEEGCAAAAFSVSNSPIRSFTPISEATGCLIDFKKPPRSKRLVQRRR